MEYIIEVEDGLDDILTNNAKRNNISVQALIVELLKRYVIDSHIMEQSELWQRGIAACSEINLDWANL
ncbi:MAG: hypothetical protein J1G38_06160 [Clostridiales bacterium]|nr:hypothetical protein [Clostridiales bacterium]